MERNLQSSIHNSLTPFLPNNQIDLIKQIPNQSTLGPAFNHLLSACVDSIYNGFYKQCLDHCSVLLDITWEKLNTGHWKTVALEWRICYSIISLLKACSQLSLLLSSDANSSLAVLNVIKSCDMGLLMGAPLEDNNLSKLASHVHRTFCSETSEGSTGMVKLDSTERIKRKKSNLSTENPDLNLCGNPSSAENHFSGVRNSAADRLDQVKGFKIELGSHVESDQDKPLCSFPENAKFPNPYSDKLWNAPKNSKNTFEKKEILDISQNVIKDKSLTKKMEILAQSSAFNSVSQFPTDSTVLKTVKTEQIERLKCPSIERFQREFFQKGNPLIITDAISFWPAMNKWNLDYIKEIAGSRLVPVEIGSKYTEDSWTQKLMTISDFIKNYILQLETEKQQPVGYLAQHQLFEQIHELQEDIIIPTYCCLGDNEDISVNAWFGPKGTVSPLHYDPKHNFLCQVMGEKYIRLYSPHLTDSLYPHEGHLLKNTSQIDVEKPDFEKFPLFKDLPYMELVLKPGEMLYMPPKYWHFVKSLSISFSVSFWWE